MGEAICERCKRPDDGVEPPSDPTRCGTVHAADGCGRPHAACLTCEGRRASVRSPTKSKAAAPAPANGDKCLHDDCKHPLATHNFHGRCLVKKKPDGKYVAVVLAELPAGWKACACPGVAREPEEPSEEAADDLLDDLLDDSGGVIS